jgi:hypothetical protein
MFAKLFRKGSSDSAQAEIESLLASNQTAEIYPAEISHIAIKHKLKPSALRDISVRLWKAAVEAFVSDDEITEPEADFMASLRRVLQISEDEAMEVERAVIHPRFKRHVTDLLADGQLTDEERAPLDKVREGLRISPGEYELLYGPAAKSALEDRLNRILEDQRVSPDEMIGLGRTAEGMGIKIKLGPTDLGKISRYAEFWKIENGEIPEVAVTIKLQKGERCHFVSSGTWYEPRTKTVTTDYGSVGYSFRIARGVYYRSPRIRATRVRQDVLTVIDTGTVYFTNKRVIFYGQHRNSTLKLNSLLGFEVWSDAISLRSQPAGVPSLASTGMWSVPP